MKKELMVGFRLDMYEVSNPQLLAKKLRPENCKRSIWIPQTMGDQIWLWFEFETQEEKEKYISQLRTIGNFKPKKNFMHEEKWLTQAEIDHWTK
jgi:hypothetical protein